jgi:ribonuclease HI
MAYAWIALDADGFILESYRNILPSIFPSALRSEIAALISGLDSLPRDSRVTITTDCAQLISLWSLYVDKPFSPRMLKEPNHLLWTSIRQTILDKNLHISFVKVAAHSTDDLNNQVDSLAKSAHLDNLLQTLSPRHSFPHHVC